MRQITIDRTPLKLSRFGFGTSRLLNAGSSRHRQRLLAAAYDHGLTHFDTAPYYGFGVGERDLRPLLARHPDATVATKVGIYPPGGADQIQLGIYVRKAGGKVFPMLSKPIVDWTVQRARQSLDESLKRLGRDHVDLYLLHEPEAHLLATDEWRTWLDAERDRVLAYGIACAAQRVGPFVKVDHPLAQVVQCSDSIERQEAQVMLDAGRRLQITFGYLASALRSADFHAEAVLARALRRNPEGCILVSTSREERLRLFARVAESEDTGQQRPLARAAEQQAA